LSKKICLESNTEGNTEVSLTGFASFVSKIPIPSYAVSGSLSRQNSQNNTQFNGQNKSSNVTQPICIHPKLNLNAITVKQ
jgi:hypothetical protein